MNNLSRQVLNFFPSSLKRVLYRDSREDLSDSVNATLVLFNMDLLHIESGNTISIAEGYQVEDLAIAAGKLLGSTGDKLSIRLLLPSSDFAATEHSLPGVTKDNLTSALQLQVESIHPSLDKRLALAFDPSISVPGSDTVVIWMEQELLDNLFDAFDNQGLFLACAMPRLLNLKMPQNKIGFLEKDNVNETLVIFDRKVVKSWRQVHKIDLEQREFSEQWLGSVKSYNEEWVQRINETNHLANLVIDLANTDYNYFPTGALDVRRKVERGRRVLFATCFSAMLLLLLAIPFIQQSFEFRSAADSLEVNRLLSLNARQDQQTVVDFENQWGPLNDFPDQVVNEALFALQNLLSPERLSSLEISEGLIKLQGSSADPQAILQKLEQDPLFTEVLFSRATSNTRYYIDLRLSPVNFEAYMIRYFPDS